MQNREASGSNSTKRESCKFYHSTTGCDYGDRCTRFFFFFFSLSDTVHRRTVTDLAPKHVSQVAIVTVDSALLYSTHTIFSFHFCIVSFFVVVQLFRLLFVFSNALACKSNINYLCFVIISVRPSQVPEKINSLLSATRKMWMNIFGFNLQQTRNKTKQIPSLMQRSAVRISREIVPDFNTVQNFDQRRVARQCQFFNLGYHIWSNE